MPSGKRGNPIPVAFSLAYLCMLYVCKFIFFPDTTIYHNQGTTEQAE